MPKSHPPTPKQREQLRRALDSKGGMTKARWSAQGFDFQEPTTCHVCGAKAIYQWRDKGACSDHKSSLQPSASVDSERQLARKQRISDLVDIHDKRLLHRKKLRDLSKQRR